MSPVPGKYRADSSDGISHGRNLRRQRIFSTMRSGQDAMGAQFLDRTDIEVLEDGARAPSAVRPLIAGEDRAAVTKNATGETGRRLFQQHEIYRFSRRRFRAPPQAVRAREGLAWLCR